MSLADDLIRDEGNVPYCYQDSRGYWTIGNGFLIDRAAGGHLPEPVRAFWLDYLIKLTQDAVRKEWPWVVTRPQQVQDGIDNAAYNLGVHGLAEFKRGLACLQAGDYAGAADAFLDSTWAKQVGPRAQRIAEKFRSAA